MGNADGGSQYSVTSSADSKMLVWIVWILMLDAREVETSASAFWREMESSRRMDIHSVALRLECWNRSISGVLRRREVYWRCSWLFLYSGGLWEGGWVG